jgi:protein-tyrosine phosphatase
LSQPVNVLFVCTANICRSPMAQGLLEQRSKQAGLEPALSVDSAGTHPFRVGQAPDEDAQCAVAARGVDVSSLRARLVEADDFRRFDFVLAMDRDNLQLLRYTCPASRRHILHLYLQFAPTTRRDEIPDPYKCGGPAFEKALDLIELATTGFLDHLRQLHDKAGNS